MPQVLIHASLVSSSSLSVLNIDHCLTLHPFSLNSLLFWHDLIHIIGVEIMATIWFMSKLGLQDTQRELRHPKLDPRNITLTMSNISKLSIFHIGTIHFLGNRNTISTPYLPAPSCQLKFQVPQRNNMPSLFCCLCCRTNSIYWLIAKICPQQYFTCFDVP